MITSKPIPASLKKVRQQFEAWRKNRESKRSRIPQSLWTVAVKASREYGNHRAARALRLNPDCLKKRVEATHRTHKRREQTPTFVEVLPSEQRVGSEYSVELEDVSGARMKIHVKGEALPDLALLTSSFWRGDA